MIKQVTMYAADCDRCGSQWHHDVICAYTDKSDVEEMIANSDGIVMEDGKTYCFNCYTIGDNDEIVILPPKATEGKQEGGGHDK